MKHIEKKEIELLLRNLAKTERAKASGSIAQDPMSEHLDADELSVFAEGRLPPATRSLYMAHLAACDRCRSIVAQLATASAIGISVSEPIVKQSRWTFLSKFFTPTVMRYAMPTLAVVVLAVAVFVWMQRESATRVAQRANTEAATQALDDKANAQVANQSTRTAATAQNSSATKSGSTAETQREKKDKDTAAASGEKRAGEKSADAKSEETKSADTASTGGVATSASPAPAKAVDAYAPPPPAKKEAEVAEEVSRTRDEETERRQRPAGSPSNAAAREERAADKNSAPKRSPSSIAGGRVAGLMAQTPATRTVGGRNFQRIDDAWVDTAYTSSTPTINVKRGSDQYRALIGDEPELRTIAEQLSGEVIVIWKGKAYRIR